MSDAAQVGVEQPIIKSEFARRRNVSAARVSQWIAEGKISGDALSGTGRDQKIVESIACQQLQQRLDMTQRLGGNGLATKLDAPPAPPQAQPLAAQPVAPSVIPFPQKGDQVADQIAGEKLAQLQRANRRQAIAEAAEAGQLTDAAAATQAAGRNAAQMITVFEGALPELAQALAAKFELPHRDLLHLLRAEFRKVRANAAALMRRQAQDMPATVAIEIETEAAADDSSDIERGPAGDGSDGEGVGAAAAG